MFRISLKQIIVSFYLLLWISSAQADSDSFRYYLEKANQSIKNGSFENGLFYLESASMIEPSNHEVKTQVKLLKSRNIHTNSYDYYFTLAKMFYDENDLELANFYFRTALAIEPESKEILEYLNKLEKLKDKSSEKTTPKYVKTEISIEPDITNTNKNPNVINNDKEKELKLDKAFEEAKENIAIESIVESIKPEKPQIDQTTPAISNQNLPIKEIPLSDIQKSKQNVSEKTSETLKFVNRDVPDIQDNPSGKSYFIESNVKLDDNLWAQQPNTTLKIELNKAILIKSQYIKRYLMITEGYVEVERISNEEIKLKAVKRGTSIFHIWEENRRWTFNLEVILPQVNSNVKTLGPTKTLLEKKAKPIQFSYSNDWGSNYLGDSPTTMQRTGLNFTQWMGVYGETPYGNFDSSVTFTKFLLSTEATGYGVGFSEVNNAIVQDFSIRGYDVNATLSPLTLAGRGVRGILVNGRTLDRKIGYMYFNGFDRKTFGNFAPGIIGDTESNLEGFKLSLYPDENNSFAANFVRGFGDLRDKNLKERSISLQSLNKLNDNLLFDSEFGYDEDKTAQSISSKWNKDNKNLNLTFRNLEPGYNTITGIPANNGEIGGQANFSINYEKININSFLDLYKSRDSNLARDVDLINFDFNTSTSIKLSNDLSIHDEIYFVDTPGLTSPRKDFRISNTLSQQFKFLENQIISPFIGHAYQQSRTKLSRDQEYNRNTFTAGVGFPLFSNVSFFTNYDYSIVEEQLSKQMSYPTVWTMGLGYNRQLTKYANLTSSLSYRNEERTDKDFSFLSGQDNMTGTVGVTFNPSDDVEIYMDTRISNIWKESSNSIAYNEADFRLGMRSTWDSPFYWNPKGYIHGFVMNDLNGNKILDESDKPVSDILINIGDNLTKTDTNGEFVYEVKAKEITVQLKHENLPQGFLVESESSLNVKILNGGVSKTNFLVSSKSSVFGVVYYDINSNKQLDNADQFIPKVVLTIDNKLKAVSGTEGAFYFNNITPGKHQLRIDINSLAIDFVPEISINTEVIVEEGKTFIFNVPLKKLPPKPEE